MDKKAPLKRFEAGEPASAHKFNMMVDRINSLSPISTPSVQVQEWSQKGLKLKAKKSKRSIGGDADILAIFAYIDFGFHIDQNTKQIHFNGGELADGRSVANRSLSCTGGTRANPLYYFIEIEESGTPLIQGPQASRPPFLQGSTINVPLASFYTDAGTIYLARIHHVGMPDIGGI